MKTKSEKKKMNTVHVLTLKQMAKIIGGDEHGPQGGSIQDLLIKK